eukprot:CAMPEP_0169129310 /NCGR_PEP_ID=MMETSP1015-20121227/37058_1 /TAXON_ID=342587 /ORGANISM="Karlodinium micrum, Strain CCMP2283" /LENGTH=209 /DNA_ID=CAMNT_0009193321 /DNA_START=90 /DNA_END=718 /DNA_ORIENTATION=+
MAAVDSMEVVEMMQPQDMDVDDGRISCYHGSPGSPPCSTSTKLGSEADKSEDYEGIDEDEYYDFLREMGCDFEQADDDDDESICSEDDEEEDIPPFAPPSTTATAAMARGGMAPASCKQDLPAFEGLDSATSHGQGPTPSFTSKTADLTSMAQDRPHSLWSDRGHPTSIAPGPSRWLLQALHVAQTAAAAVRELAILERTARSAEDKKL